MSKFYICSICGNLVEKITDGGTIPSCCNRQMTELRAGSTDGVKEKHIPIITSCKEDGDIKCINVTVGEILHPSEESHHIEWIELETDKGTYRRKLDWNEKPSVEFCIPSTEEVKCVYEYCNLHGLWAGGDKKCVSST